MLVLVYRTSQITSSGYVGALSHLAPAIFVQILIFWWLGEGYTVNPLWFFLGLLITIASLLEKTQPVNDN